MGIERYLCVGGIEIANPCRTLAYLRNLGSPCLVRPPSKRDCGCCEEWEPQLCEAVLEAGFYPNDETVCIGIAQLGPDAYWNATIRQIVIPCPEGGERPPIPDADDPGWTEQLIPALPAVLLTGLLQDPSQCPSWEQLASGFGEGGPFGEESEPGDPSLCAFVEYRLQGVESGASFQVWTYFAPGSIDPIGHDLGLCAFSLDGITWSLTVATTGGIPCPSSGGTLQLVVLQQPGDEEYCSGFLSVEGIGPFQLLIRTIEPFPVPPASPADIPPDSDPAWTVQGSGIMPAPVPPLGQCAPYVEDPPAGLLSSVRITDLGTGLTLDLIAWLDAENIGPGTLGGSIYSTDGGASWAPMPIGLLTLSAASPGIPGEFVSPAADDAPWYDPQVPESADVLGVFIEEARLSTPWSREARDRLKGSSLSPGRLRGRELTISGWLYTRSEAATAYGRQWLFEALAGSGCEEGCDLPDAEIYTHCQRAGGSSGARALKRVGLTAFDPEIEPEYPRSCGLKFEATLTAEIPELFLEASLQARLALGDPDDPIVCAICQPCPEPDAAPCSCGALDQPPRVVPEPGGISGFCQPIEIRRASQAIAAPAYWREATAVLSISGGSEGLSNLRIRGWANPAGLAAPTADEDLFACREPCLDVEIACVPAGAELVIDGTTRRASLICEGLERDGYRFLSSSGGQRFAWPDVGCAGLMLVADADAAHTSPDAELALQVIPRERG